MAPIHQDRVYARSARASADPSATIWLSEESWAFLTEQAKRALYVKVGSLKPRGITEYIRALFIPTRIWRDTRPQWLVDRSLVITDASRDKERRRISRLTTGSGRATGGSFPLWWDAETIVRIHRTFKTTDMPYTEMARLAVLWGITSPRRNEFQFDVNLAAGNVLEAVGQQTLTANVEPSNPTPSHAPIRRDKNPYKEIAW